MPIFTLNTNVESAKVPADFCSKMTEFIAKGLGKPKAYIALQINSGKSICFAGDCSQPAALCDLVSIGALSTDTNKQLTKTIMDYLSSAMSIPPSRCYINFHDVKMADVGYNGTTFA